MDTIEALGPRIRRQRRRLGLTLDELAGRTSISKPYLSLIETGRVANPPSDEKLRRLEQTLGFAAGDLLTQAHLQRTPRDVRAVLHQLMASSAAAQSARADSPPWPPRDTGALSEAAPASTAHGNAIVGAAQAGDLHSGAGQLRAPHESATPHSAPHTSAPHSGAPHTGAPHTGAPHSGAPHTGAPHTGGPHTGAPPIGGPHTGAPHMRTPQEDAAHAHTPFAQQTVPAFPRHARSTGDVLHHLVERSSGHVERMAATAVPVINRPNADYPRDFCDPGYPARVADEYLSCPDLTDRDAFAARVHGDSMTPKYRAGDVVIFSPALGAHDGDDCFVRFADGVTTFKRIFFETTDAAHPQVRLQPRNERYRPQIVPSEKIAGLYKAVYRYQRVDEE